MTRGAGDSSPLRYASHLSTRQLLDELTERRVIEPIPYDSAETELQLRARARREIRGALIPRGAAPQEMAECNCLDPVCLERGCRAK